MSSVRATPSPPPLPPIITNEKDREFLLALNAHIDSDLSQVDATYPEQRFIIYKVAFDQIIEYVSAYKPLLTAIKAEYEECIETIVRGQREAFYLSGKLKSMAHEPSTLHNYRRRGEDLQSKISIIDADNAKLNKEIQKLAEDREEREKHARTSVEKPQKEMKRERKPIPGLTLQQSTDVKTLTRLLDKVERQLKEITLSHKTRFTLKEIKDQLKESLAQKVSSRDDLTEDTEVLKVKRHKLKVAVEAAQAYLRIQPPHQTIGDAVILALAQSSYSGAHDRSAGPDELGHGSPNTSFDDDDPTREKEAEMMLEYIEKFNELMEEEKFEAAAIHAANSPKGILRTPETLARFKELKTPLGNRSGRSPLLAFCDALMSTVLAYGVRPSEYLSMECIACALKEHRMDLLSHWMSQDRLTTTEDLGLMIYNYSLKRSGHELQSGLALAQKIFMDVKSVYLVMACMVRQGRVSQGIDYGRSMGAQQHDYVEVLQECPTPQLAHALHVCSLEDPLVPLGVIARTLVSSKAEGIALHLIEEIHKRSSSATPSKYGSLRDAIFRDKDTTESDWLKLSQRCQETGYTEAAVDVLATVTVMNAIDSARQRQLGTN